MPKFSTIFMRFWFFKYPKYQILFNIANIGKLGLKMNRLLAGKKDMFTSL